MAFNDFVYINYSFRILANTVLVIVGTSEAIIYVYIYVYICIYIYICIYMYIYICIYIYEKLSRSQRPVHCSLLPAKSPPAARIEMSNEHRSKIKKLTPQSSDQNQKNQHRINQSPESL